MPFTPIAKAEIGAIVTSLEMRNKPSLRALPATDLRLERWPNPTADKYRTLYRRIGEPWLWFSRLTLDDAEFIAYKANGEGDFLRWLIRKHQGLCMHVNILNKTCTDCGAYPAKQYEKM